MSGYNDFMFYESDYEDGESDYEGTCDWCKCDHCSYIGEYNLCCQDIPKIFRKTQEYGVPCITLHPGFEPVVLNDFVLETAYCGYHPYKNWENYYPQYRYTAYRQLVRWCWGYLGKNNRVQLPSCAISKIRRTFN
ncbi:hypothetical protein GDO86_012391 [Hymenochirus boettgeri]|uniref:P2X purinoreceptor 7 intracellular domain-containing protein n=1 Tax=Hymenochirus boettgeri TaxID=247094 RepID=A0A8T2IMA3_9PIPI|nr:hypothetical protein GDO86_012391 [Hymenochirus boettgeri]